MRSDESPQFGTVDPGADRRLRDVSRTNESVLAGVRVVMAPLVLAALVLSLGRWRALAIVVLPALCYAAGLSATFMQERFRERLDPLLAIPLAALLGDIIAGGADAGPRPRRWVKGVVAVTLLAAAAWLHATGRTTGWYRLAGPPARVAAKGAGRSSGAGEAGPTSQATSRVRSAATAPTSARRPESASVGSAK